LRITEASMSFFSHTKQVIFQISFIHFGIDVGRPHKVTKNWLPPPILLIWKMSALAQPLPPLVRADITLNFEKSEFFC